MRKFLKNRMGVALLLLGGLLLVASPAVAQAPDEEALDAADDAYFAQQELDEALFDIEANKEAFVQELAERFDLAEEVANTLLEKDAETLLEISQADSWEEYLGQTTSELVLYPLKPCRIVDTRYAPRWGFNPIASQSQINIDVYGDTSSQKDASSSPANCGVSSDAAAVVINVTAIPVGNASGWLTVWPYLETPRPQASLVNFDGRDNLSAIANAVTQKINRGGADQLSVWARNPAHVAIDVIGYFARPSKSALYKSVRTASKTIRALTVENVTVSCLTGYTLTGGGCALNSSGSLWNITETRPSGNGWFCEGWNGSILNRTIYVYAVCNKTPGR